MSEIAEIRQSLAAGSVNPRDLKMRLARDIIGQIDGAAAATAAEENFVRVHQKRDLPEEIANHAISEPTNILDLIVAAQMAPSKSEARRLIGGGGVRINGNKVEGFDLVLEPGSNAVIQVGRRRFVRVV